MKKEALEMFKRKVERDALIKPSISFICPILNKQIRTKDFCVSHSASPCDLCGSHGYVHLDVKCECEEKSHEISLSEW